MSDGQTYLRLTPGGRLTMRRSIRELESSLDVSDSELAEQEAGTLPADCEGLQLAMMAQSCVSEHRFIQSPGNFWVPQR